jgi:hypothetical protein
LEVVGLLPLYRVIREEKSLAHSIGAYSWMPADGPWNFSVYAEIEPENKETVEKEILSQIENLRNSDLTRPIARAFRQIASQQFKTLTTASGRASDLASNWHSARDLNYTRSAIQKAFPSDRRPSSHRHRIIPNQGIISPSLLWFPKISVINPFLGLGLLAQKRSANTFYQMGSV